MMGEQQKWLSHAHHNVLVFINPHRTTWRHLRRANASSLQSHQSLALFVVSFLRRHLPKQMTVILLLMQMGETYFWIYSSESCDWFHVGLQVEDERRPKNWDSFYFWCLCRTLLYASLRHDTWQIRQRRRSLTHLV